MKVPTRVRAAVVVRLQRPSTVHVRFEALTSIRRVRVLGPPCHVEDFGACLIPPAGPDQVYKAAGLSSKGTIRSITHEIGNN